MSNAGNSIRQVIRQVVPPNSLAPSRRASVCAGWDNLSGPLGFPASLTYIHIYIYIHITISLFLSLSLNIYIYIYIYIYCASEGFSEGGMIWWDISQFELGFAPSGDLLARRRIRTINYIQSSNNKHNKYNNHKTYKRSKATIKQQ